MEMQFITDGDYPWPGCCARCGVGRGPMLDLGINVPEPQETLRPIAVLICPDCFHNMAELMNYVSPSREKKDDFYDAVGTLVDSISTIVHDHNTNLRDELTEKIDEARRHYESSRQSDGPVISEKSDGVSSDPVDELLSIN